MTSEPRLGISEISTISATFEEDLAAYRGAGAEGVGIWEFKLRDDASDRRLLRESGLTASVCVPAVPSILPLPFLEGPEDPEQRVEALRRSLPRLAAFEPAAVLCLTGPAGERGEGEARRLVVEALRDLADVADRVGVRFGVEPLHRSTRADWTIVDSIPETLELLDEVGKPSLGILFDTYHLWDTPTLHDDIAHEVERFVGVHVADWREPPRSSNDRALPGDGVARLPTVLAALDESGYDGWYDVEIFSDMELADSLWRLEPTEFARRAVAAFHSVWQARATPA